MTLPNQLTILRIVLTPIFVTLFLSDKTSLKQLSLIVYIVAALTDWYDGWIARKFGYATRWGRFLDPLADKILTSSAFIAFASIGLLTTWMVILVVVRDILITLLRSYAELKDKPVITTKSAKVKTFVQMVFIYYLLFGYVLNVGFEINLESTLLNPNLIFWSMLLITILTVWTGFVYIYDNWKIIKTFYVSASKGASESI